MGVHTPRSPRRRLMQGLAPQAPAGDGAAPADPPRAFAPPHPGALFTEIVLPAIGKSKVELAELLGVSRTTLYAFLGGRFTLSAELALRIGKLCGNGPEFWMNLQTRHDLAVARKLLGKQLDAIPTLEGVDIAA